jgi:carbonic anhydrase
MTFPWVRERVEHGTLMLHGWYFDIERGQLLRFNTTTNTFE